MTGPQHSDLFTGAYGNTPLRIACCTLHPIILSPSLVMSEAKNLHSSLRTGSAKHPAFQLTAGSAKHLTTSCMRHFMAKRIKDFYNTKISCLQLKKIDV
jgi:hypothetical protein